MISVIIATKNRAEALETISLPSLMRQDCADFELILWDASDDDSSERVAEKFKPGFEKRGIDLIYVKALRIGSASQRNDAVKSARGDAVFFIDDDSEVSSNGVSVVARTFADFAWLRGMALPLVDKRDIGEAIRHGVIAWLKAMIRVLFWGHEATRRAIRKSTVNVMARVDAPGHAEWLSGCDMAFRRTVFDELSFDERLQQFGGYALAEDVDLSHRVLLKWKEPLIVTGEGFVVHHNAIGGRLSVDWRRHAAGFFNTYIIRENFKKYRSQPLFAFLWETRIGPMVAMLSNGNIYNTIKGFVEYKRAVRGLNN